MAAIGGDTGYYAQKIDRVSIYSSILEDCCAIELGVGSWELEGWELGVGLEGWKVGLDWFQSKIQNPKYPRLSQK